MKSLRFLIIKSILVSLILVTNSIVAQSGTLTGVVKDIKGEPLPFVNIVSVEVMKGGSSDVNGMYRFMLPVGIHKVFCSSIGFVTDTVEIEIKLDETTTYDFVMVEESNIMVEFKISKTRSIRSEASVINDIKESKQIVNAVGGEMIEKTQDSDASEVVKRVPGVTVVGNNFIMIRGLNERYNNVLLHDVFAPSMETDVKSFAFDIIPANMIDRVMIYKSPSPEITGEFAGGVVKIYTKGIPDSNSTSISFSTTYRSGSSFQEFLQPKRSGMHWIGLNDGYNDLPGGFPNNISRLNSNEVNLIDQVGRSLKNNWTPESVNSLMDRGFAFSHAHKWQWGKVTVGNITSVSYSNARTIFNNERNDYNAYDSINNKSSYIYTFNDQQFSQNIRTGILHNWAFKFSDKTTIEFKNLFNAISNSQYTNRRGYDYEFNYSPNNHAFNQVYRGIYSGQLVGKHNFNDNNTKLNWTVGLGLSYRDQPDYRRFRSEIDTTNGEQQLFVGIPVSPNYLGRFYSELRENSESANIAFEHKFTKTNYQPIFKAGFFFERKVRDFKARNIGYKRSNFMSFDQELLYGSIDNLFLPENINQTTGIRIDEDTKPSDSYNASNYLSALYFGAELPLGKNFNLNTGVRTEYNVQTLNSELLTGERIVINNPILSVLPSANLTYEIKEDKTFLRLAYGKSVNRPEFRELAPFGFYDFNFNLVKKGNDSIKTPRIHNFDFRIENYPNAGEMITFAVFYKKFIDPIETLFIPGGGSGGIKTFSYGNAAFATSMGIELEMRKSLKGLFATNKLDNFSLVINGSLIKSRVNLGMEGLGQSNERPLQGQSPYIVNAGVFYQNEKGLQMNVLYNMIGPRIFIIGFDAYPDIYEMPRGVLDLNFSKKLKHNMELKWNIQDILNQDVLLLQDANRNGKYERKTDQVIQRYKPGTTFTVGFGVKF